MNKFLASLTPGQTKMFYATVFIVVLALFDLLLVRPTMAKLTVIDDNIQSEENSIKSDLRFLAYKDRILKESELYQPYYADTIPKEEEVMAAFLEKLDTFVKESGLTLIKNNRSNDPKESDKESKDFLVYKADLEATGNLENMAKLMYAIDTSKEFFKILKFNLAMKKTGDVEEMKSVMTVAKIIPLTTSISVAASPETTKAAPAAAGAR